MPSWATLGRFLGILAASIVGGWLWSSIGLPLGWLMGAAVVTGGFAMAGVNITVFDLPRRAGLILIGASVGLTMSPEAASQFLSWAPLMVFAALLGIAAATILAPTLARFGRMSPATAYFCLLPGGVIEMARIGEDNGADPTTIAAIHAVRVALVVTVLPLALFAVLPGALEVASAAPEASILHLTIALAVGALGGLIGDRVGLPAAWLLGPVLAVGAIAAFGAVGGTVPSEFLAVAQVIVGMALGARFRRDRMLAIPRAIAVGIPAVLGIMLIMALAALLAASITSQGAPSLILAFSIGGMAEMVLTAKQLGQDALMVAAFQIVRAVIVNSGAGVVWRHVGQRFFT